MYAYYIYIYIYVSHINIGISVYIEVYTCALVYIPYVPAAYSIYIPVYRYRICDSRVEVMGKSNKIECFCCEKRLNGSENTSRKISV